ncbi:MAG: cytochrome-c peroxidase [Gammaproteobacteria bacterium]
MQRAHRTRALECAIALAVGTAGNALAQAQPDAIGSEPLRPLPLKSDADPARAALGKRLFFDARLSGSGRHSCASCHDLARGGSDGRRLPVPITGQPGRYSGLYNTLSIYNTSFNFKPSWIGRPINVDTMAEHVEARNWDGMIAPLLQDSALAGEFRSVYGSELNAASARDALGHYLRSLITPSRFDRYLRGERRALNDEELAGYARFKSYGCVACHQGINVGGNMFSRLGAMQDVPTGGPGRQQLTGRAADYGVYRVPSLRNVALSAPYFHDGSVETLQEAVDLMFRHELGRAAPQKDKELIVRFLTTLSGERMPPPGAAP